MDSAYHQDTQVEAVGDGEFRTEISDRWNITTVPNGGYVLSLILSAVTQTTSHTDPLSATAHYLGKTIPGPATIRTNALKDGRSLSTVEFGLTQNDRLVVSGIATLGDLTRQSGPDHVMYRRFELGASERVLKEKPNIKVFKMGDQLDFRIPAKFSEAIFGEPTDTAHVQALLRFSDGTEPDLNSLALFSDAMPPAVFLIGQRGWTPTIELTVHFRAHPQPGWLWTDFRTEFLQDGLLEEDGRIWDDSGQLVALSRQLAQIPTDPKYRMID